jgi:hypothetical protein
MFIPGVKLSVSTEADSEIGEGLEGVPLCENKVAESTENIRNFEDMMLILNDT